MTAWRAINRDPNSDLVRQERRRKLLAARSNELTFDRNRFLAEIVRGKSVLDVGIVNHTMDATDDPAWLHGHLAREARRCLGVDILKPEIDQLKKRFNVLVADITAGPLEDHFDVITAGEVIEHIDRPGAMFQNCATMLESGGELILTTPNPWYLNAVLKNLLQRDIFLDSADHVAWYDASTLCELGERYGLRLVRYTGVGITRPESLLARLMKRMQPLWILVGFSPLLFAKSIIYEFTLQPG